MSTKYTVIRLDRNGPIAEVVLDNPDRLNAMAPVFFTEIKQAFEEIDADPEIRVAILWAEGRLFTAGLDLKAALEGGLGGNLGNGSVVTNNLDMYKTIHDLQDAMSAVENCRKPVMAAVHRHWSRGGGGPTTEV